MIQLDETSLTELTEKPALEQLETHIKYWGAQLTVCIGEIGKALKIINDGELYKEAGFDSFQDYLNNRAFGMRSIGYTQGMKYIAVYEDYGVRLNTIGVTNLDVLYTLRKTPIDVMDELVESGKLAEMTVKDARDYKKELEAAREQISLLTDEVKTLSEDYDRSEKVNEHLNNEMKKLSERPIEVVSPSEEDIAKIKADARKELEEEYAGKVTKAVREALDNDRKNYERDTKTYEKENSRLLAELDKLTAEKESSDSRIKELEADLQSTEKNSADVDENLIEFRFYFNEVQNYMQKFLDVIDKVNDPGKQEKFRGAAEKYLETLLNDLGGDDD